jgi:hypothetical protein
MQDANIVPPKALEVIAFAEEEGRFGGMLGSQAITGNVDYEWMKNAKDAFGVPLLKAMESQGLANALETVESCSRRKNPPLAFVELHIEQGPVLEREKIPIGIVTSISGCANNSWILNGRANHAGKSTYIYSSVICLF